MKHSHDLRVPWLTHWQRAARAPFVADAKPWHTHLWRGLLSLGGSRKYAPPSARDLLENLIVESRETRAQLQTAVTELRRHRNRANRLVLAHAAGLADPAAPVVVSQSLELAAAGLQPLMHERASEIVVCTVALGAEYRQTVRRCLESQERYCARHGYTYADLAVTPDHLTRPAAWCKISLIYNLLRAGYRHVFYLDADCLVTNPGFRLEELIARLGRAPATKALLATTDGVFVNCGVLLTRNTPAALRLLDMIWLHDATAGQPNWEQDALSRLLDEHPEARGAIEVEQTPKFFNSFPHERQEFFRTPVNCPNVWSPGDFICHFSGIRPPHLQRMIDQYADETAAP